jgi:Flp pilus assembly protein TadD
VFTRGLLAAVALAAIAWFGAGLRAFDAHSEAQQLTQELRDAPERNANVSDSLEALRDTRPLLPDGESMLVEGELLAAAGRGEDAAAVARRLVATEPDNDRAWFLAYLTSGESERPRALRRLTELNPWAADSLR